jgi:hypothetical protein
LLTTDSQVQGRFLLQILRRPDDGVPWSWRTQINLVGECGRSRPDMIGDSPNHLVLVVAKIDAPVDPDQLKAHRRNAAKAARNREVIVVLLARDGATVPDVDAAIAWPRIQSLVRSPNDGESSIAAQFVEFLGMEGLGRIPGLCLTFWKASILEALSAVPDGAGRGSVTRIESGRFWRSCFSLAMSAAGSQI